MTTDLLTTKLRVPRAPHDLLSRPRLISRLDAVWDRGPTFSRRLTLLSAPAGFGKTTLLAAWLQELGQGTDLKVGWLSLDPSDNDLIRFWSYVISALRRTQHDLGHSAEGLLQATGMPLVAQSGSMLGERVATQLLNEIDAETKPTLLVLDDYHVIEEPTVHRGLTFLIDHLSPQLHLVIATRADPPLPLSRLRGRGQLVELRAVDLAFTPQETAAFLNSTMALNLAPDAIEALATQAEGWPVGLQMASLAFRAHQNLEAAACANGVPNLLAGLAQTERHMLDYLADEVFSQQTKDVQAFLLRTSVLDRLCGPLCDALMKESLREAGTSPGAEMLQQLERDNLFITPLDETLTWYRVHPLFRDLLQRRLAQCDPTLLPGLHLRASCWYEEQGLIDNAIEHTLSAKDYERAVDLVEARAEAALMRSENATVLRWLEALPDQLIRTRPTLCGFHAWALLLNGRSPEIAAQRLADASHGGAGDQMGVADTLRALMAVMRGDLEAAIDLAQQARAHLPDTASFMHTVAANTVGIASVSRGDLASATRAFGDAVVLARQAGNTMMEVAALCNQAGIQMVRGELRSAQAAYERALALSTNKRGQRLPVAAKALLGLGELAREWNDLSAAEAYLTDALTLCDRYGEIGSLMCLLTLVRVKIAQGDLGRAEALVMRAREIAAASQATQADDRVVAAAEARVWTAQGRPELAAIWAQQISESDGAAGPIGSAAEDRQGRRRQDDDIYEEAERIGLARLRLALAKPGEALVMLQPLKQRAESAGRYRRLVEILALESLALALDQRTEEALAVLHRALQLAEPEGYVRTFADEGPAMARLLIGLLSAHRWQGQEGFRAYVQRLVAATAEIPAPSTSATETDRLADRELLIEPLSGRELEVLRLIACGYTNREIGEALFIALDTVKGHTRQIYSKLDVHNRTQAVTRAQAIGLLPLA